jgi:hypothetical protein
MLEKQIDPQVRLTQIEILKPALSLHNNNNLGWKLLIRRNHFDSQVSISSLII